MLQPTVHHITTNVKAIKHWYHNNKFFAEIDVVDGVSIFAPKIKIKKADCGTLIQKLWQTNLHGGKTATPPGGFILNVDSYVSLALK